MSFIRMVFVAACMLEFGIVAGGFIPGLAAGIARYENAIMTLFGVVCIALAALITAGLNALRAARTSRPARLLPAGDHTMTA